MTRRSFPGVKKEYGVWYHRRTRTRLGTEYASEEFCRLYWEAEKGGKAAHKAGRTLGTLITHYRGSDRYGDLKPRTRSDYDKVLDYIGEKAGHTPVAHWQRRHVIDVMDGNRHRVRFANYIVAVLSVVFEHAIDIGWLAENPAKGVRKIKTEVKHHLPWPPEVVDAYRQVASNHALLAMELGIATGQRPSDLVKLRWCDWDGEGFTLV
ncbi:MAG: integrase, partial [Pseudomonadota bacterium]